MCLKSNQHILFTIMHYVFGYVDPTDAMEILNVHLAQLRQWGTMRRVHGSVHSYAERHFPLQRLASAIWPVCQSSAGDSERTSPESCHSDQFAAACNVKPHGHCYTMSIQHKPNGRCYATSIQAEKRIKVSKKSRKKTRKNHQSVHR